MENISVIFGFSVKFYIGKNNLTKFPNKIEYTIILYEAKNFLLCIQHKVHRQQYMYVDVFCALRAKSENDMCTLTLRGQIIRQQYQIFTLISSKLGRPL